MPVAVILGCSIVLQLAAAVLAIRLIRITGKTTAWILLAAAICLMAARRCVTFYELITDDTALAPGLTPELIALVISVLMLAGLAWIAPLFREHGKNAAALVRVRDRAKNFLDIIRVIIVSLDGEGRVTLINRRGLEVLDRAAADVIGQNWFDLCIPERDREETRKAFESLIGGGAVSSLCMENEILTRSGEERIISWQHSLLRDVAGEVSGLVCSGDDITELLQAERRRLASEQRFSSIVESIPLGLHLYRLEEDGTLRFEGANPAADKILGMDHSPLAGKPIEEAFPGLEGTDIPDKYRAVAAGGESWQTDQVIYDHGDIKGAFLVNAFRTAPGRMAAGFLDITDRRRAREAIERSEERFRSIFEVVSDSILIFDPGLRILYANRSALSLLGTSSEGLVGKVFGDALAPALAPMTDFTRMWTERIGRMFESGSSREFEDASTIRGWRMYVESTLSPIRDPRGKTIAVGLIFRDVTGRKRFEQSLRESEERFRSAFDNAPIGKALVSPDGRFLKVNRALCEIVGFTEQELLSLTQQNITHPDDRERDLADMRRMLAGEGPIHQMEKRCRHKNGHEVWILQSSSLVEDAMGNSLYFISQVQNITARKDLEEQLLQSQKMEAVGRLAGGVAHDFNNLLSVILTYGSLIMQELPADDPIRDDIKEIVEAGERAAALTRQLLAFSRKQVLQPTVMNINEVVAGMDKMLRCMIGEDIALVTMLSPELGRIKVDPGQIEQVIMNLAINARDAMPMGGKLTIETAAVSLDEEYTQRHMGARPGRYVMISISDSGHGMDRKTLESIFEPFFTTKERGKGTGLGLSTVYGIVKQSAGDIWVYSETGIGTTFKLYFPSR